MNANLAPLILIVLLLSSCATISQRDPLEVSLAGLEVLEVTLLEQRYKLKLRIMNPNDSAISIRGMSYKLWLNDSKFASGVSNQAYTVPGFGETVVEADIVSGLASVLRQMQTLGGSTPQQFSYKLVGKLGIAGQAWRSPFEFSGAIELSPRRNSR